MSDVAEGRMRQVVWLIALVGCFGSSESGDTDGDGLSDALEAEHGCDPTKADTDGDGKSDGDEVLKYKTDCTKIDTDGDGVGDGAEISTYKSDPLVPDHEPQEPPAPKEAPPPPDAREKGPERPSWVGLPEPPEEIRCQGNSREPECFRKVEGGTFLMGAQATDPGKPNYDVNAQPEEGPVREVTVDGFWMLQFEVSGSAYRRCVESRGCSEEELDVEGGFSTYAKVLARGVANAPINSVTWEGARAFCAWMGGRLPTEAEWEYAARGPTSRAFPWGTKPGCGVSTAITANTNGRAGVRGKMMQGDCDLLGPAVPADLAGQSPFQLWGMAGNVWEWVDDWYAEDAYKGGAAKNPTGPETGTRRVQRGGGWTSTDPLELRSAARGSAPPDMKLNDVGFRCVWGTR